MRRDRKIPRSPGFRTSDWMRLSSMILMLAVLYVVWDAWRRPDFWRWLVNEPGVEPAAEVGAAPPQPAPPARPEPAPTGPTDEDPEQQEAIQEEFLAITDRTLQIQPEEMVAYRRILQWVLNQPAAILLKRARAHPNPSFNDLMLSPDKHRGALVELVLNARLVRACDLRAADGSELYEVWGFSQDSGTWLYCTVVVNLPEGMPVGSRVSEQVRFVGYFFKLQGYHEAGAKPHAPALAAPMLIGRLIWIPTPPMKPRQSNPMWGLILVVVVGMLVVGNLAWVLLRPKRRRASIRPLGPPRRSSPSIDQWFEQIEEGTAPIPDAPGDEWPPLHENGEGQGDGRGQAGLFGRRLDDQPRGDG